MDTTPTQTQEIVGKQNEPALTALVNATGYPLVQENGQRKFGPPPGFKGPPPPRGCEVFVGKVPRDLYEDELVPVFQKAGNIYELRLMMDFSGTNRGFAFVTYCQRSEAKRAVKELNNFEIRKGRFLGVCSSVDNCRLFVGGIPKNKVKEDIFTEMSKVTQGVVNVIVYPCAVDKTKNRGFAFVEYESHRAAAMARRKLVPGTVELWGQPIKVDWAEPEPEADEDVMSQVRVLYVRNLMLSTTEEKLQEVFTRATGREGVLERVKKLRDYAFIHFTTREDALKAMEAVNGTHIDDALVEVVLAKPVDKTEQNAQRSPTVKGAPQILSLDLNNINNATLSSVYNQILLQQGARLFASHGAVGCRGKSRGASRGRGAGGSRSYSNNNLGSRTNNQQHPAEARLLFDLLPGVELTPTNPLTLRPHPMKSPVQLLQDLCQKNNWGAPVYQLHSAIQKDAFRDTSAQFFLYKVSIPALPNHLITPNKLCRTLEEARIFAAEYTLKSLGIPVESSEIQIPHQAATSAAAYQGRPLAPAISIAREVQVPISYATPYVVPSADYGRF
ncbi:hypothetical protein RRG08_022926 [Elysia crispata]|uniref:Probable RNA-binding protein 46 n=1 Tax=Elysia crispata TaxID=231223 RepID=A0AAE0XP99_9GAST|nr:hypothetical protein RRG08_022926 [Elysia crispata]